MPFKRHSALNQLNETPATRSVLLYCGRQKVTHLDDDLRCMHKELSKTVGNCLLLRDEQTTAIKDLL